MVKTQIQLPDHLYEQAKRVARERELSLAEVVRRGVEYITAVYPPLVENGNPWSLPDPVQTTMRQDVRIEDLRDILADDIPHPAP